MRYRQIIILYVKPIIVESNCHRLDLDFNVASPFYPSERQPRQKSCDHHFDPTPSVTNCSICPYSVICESNVS